MTRRYLVVDDNLEFAENVAEILTDAGAEVCVAAGGKSALEQLRATRFDGIVTDMKMPGLSGAELLRQMRAIDPGVPVVLLSAWAQDAQVAEARRLGLLAFLSKASGTPQLIELLSSARRDATIVLIDDDRALVENLSESLASVGFTVCSASIDAGSGDTSDSSALSFSNSMPFSSVLALILLFFSASDSVSFSIF